MDLGFGHFVFSYNFDSALDISLPVHGNSNLAKATFTQNTADFITLFYIWYVFEASEIFEIENSLVFFIATMRTIAIWIFNMINFSAVS